MQASRACLERHPTLSTARAADGNRERSAAAAQGDDAADQEAGGGGADDQLAPVLADLTAPVGQLVDAVPKRLDRLAELLPLQLDVAADLRRGAPRQPGRRGRNPLRMAHGRSPSEPGPKAPARPRARVPARASLP